MKHVLRILVLLLLVNCTAEAADVDETLDARTSQDLNCIDNLPLIRLTNNGSLSFDFIVYGQDYSLLYTQSLSTTADSGWFELPSNDVIVVASNDDVGGQKIQLNLVACDNIDVEIGADDTLIVSTE